MEEGKRYTYAKGWRLSNGPWRKAFKSGARMLWQEHTLLMKNVIVKSFVSAGRAFWKTAVQGACSEPNDLFTLPL
jgi:hypothetical protein